MSIDSISKQITFLEMDYFSSILTEAIQSSARKTGLAGGLEEAFNTIQTGKCSFCERMHYEIAKLAAAYIGNHDTTVKSVHVFDPECTSHLDASGTTRPDMCPAINMIVWATSKTASLLSLKEVLEKGISNELSKIKCDHANALCSTIDIQVVDDKEVENSRGYGALLHSYFASPLLVWENPQLQ